MDNQEQLAPVEITNDDLHKLQAEINELKQEIEHQRLLRKNENTQLVATKKKNKQLQRTGRKHLDLLTREKMVHAATLNEMERLKQDVLYLVRQQSKFEDVI